MPFIRASGPKTQAGRLGPVYRACVQGELLADFTRAVVDPEHVSFSDQWPRALRRPSRADCVVTVRGLQHGRCGEEAGSSRIRLSERNQRWGRGDQRDEFEVVRRVGRFVKSGREGPVSFAVKSGSWPLLVKRPCTLGIFKVWAAFFPRDRIPLSAGHVGGSPKVAKNLKSFSGRGFSHWADRSIAKKFCSQIVHFTGEHQKMFSVFSSAFLVELLTWHIGSFWG
jgi:hypothetical protein